MNRTAIYCRLSDEDRFKNTGVSESINNQILMLTDYCKEKGFIIKDIYCDEDFSGADRKRPDFCRMLRDCESGEIDIVLCKTQSRFSRDIAVIEEYIHGKFLKWGIRFIGVVDGADTLNAANKKSRQINSLINEWYLEDLSENIKATLRQKKKLGLYTGAFCPYGFKRSTENKNILIIDKIAADYIKKIFTDYLNGKSYSEIAENFNEQKILNPTSYRKLNGEKFNNPNCKNETWSAASVRYIIRNPVYNGKMVQGKTEKISYKSDYRKKNSLSDCIVVENAMEKIISDDVWKKAQEKSNRTNKR